ncbi:MAG: vitamin K-dependent gamma-carboxylase [Myxococcota bacterium]|jgi:vitamin K-dependent gamma-carboxylase
MIAWWVGLWDRQEDARSLALLRIVLGGVILSDLLQIGQLGLVSTLYAPTEGGGLSMVLHREQVPWLYALLPPTATAGLVAYGLTLGAAVLWTVGLATPLAALLLAAMLTQLALAMPAADRGIDILIRNIVVIMAFSQSHRIWSLDAWLWRRDAVRQIPSWPRYVVVIQLVLVYGFAGLSKVSTAWMPVGHFSALYTAMHDPSVARLPAAWLPTLFPVTQLLTASTWVWELSAPVILLGLYFHDTRTRPGRIRAAFNRLQLLRLYVLIGAMFHIGTALTFNLGIFPWAMLALYPAFLHPDQWPRWATGSRPLPPSPAR